MSMSSFGTKFDQAPVLAGEPLDIRPSPLTAPVHPEAIVLHQYWLACQKKGGLKLGRDLPAREIAKLMAKLSVLESNTDGSDFRFRLVGSSWMERFGRDIQGEWLSALYQGPIFGRYREGVLTVLRTAEPRFTDVRVFEHKREAHHIEYTQLPLATSNETERCILMGAFRHE
jgi:hypothetical protein